MINHLKKGQTGEPVQNGGREQNRQNTCRGTSSLSLNREMYRKKPHIRHTPLFSLKIGAKFDWKSTEKLPSYKTHPTFWSNVFSILMRLYAGNYGISAKLTMLNSSVSISHSCRSASMAESWLLFCPTEFSCDLRDSFSWIWSSLSLQKPDTRWNILQFIFWWSLTVGVGVIAGDLVPEALNATNCLWHRSPKEEKALLETLWSEPGENNDYENWTQQKSAVRPCSHRTQSTLQQAYARKNGSHCS